MEKLSVPTHLPPVREPETRRLGTDAKAGLAVIVAMFLAGLIYWSGHANDARAAGAPASQAIGASAAAKPAGPQPGNAAQ